MLTKFAWGPCLPAGLRVGTQTLRRGLSVAQSLSLERPPRRSTPPVAPTKGCCRLRIALVGLRTGRAQAGIHKLSDATLHRRTARRLQPLGRPPASAPPPAVLCSSPPLSPVVPRHFPSWISSPVLLQWPTRSAAFGDSLLLERSLIPTFPAPPGASSQATPLWVPRLRPRAPSGVCACSLPPTAKSSKGTF